jgi:hypothetical protein
MSKHRFDHTVDHSDDTKPARQPDRLRRIEVITGVERRTHPGKAALCLWDR